LVPHDQGKHGEAEEMHRRALDGQELRNQGKHGEADY
jgi:hypothetical protein